MQNVWFRSVIEFTFYSYAIQEKIYYLTSEFYVKFHLKNRCRTQRFTIRASLNFSFGIFFFIDRLQVSLTSIQTIFVIHIMFASNLFCLFRPCKHFFNIFHTPLQTNNVLSLRFTLNNVNYFFKVTDWPKEDYGKFFSGDSYIILNTYKDKESDEVLL